MVSLKDIAKACGVSVATVSKALNGHSDIGEETKAKICLAAKEMGYLPNSNARALKTNRSNNIGVLFVDKEQSGLTHDFFAHVLDSFKKTAEARGYDLTFINTSREHGSMSYLDHCRYRGFDGVVIACVDFYDPEVEALAKSDIPLVTIDHSFFTKASVLSDNVGGMRDLVQYIISMGHERIALIHGTDSAVTRSRMSSFYRTMDEAGLKVPDEYVKQAHYRSTRLAAEMTEELLRLKTPPTCIIYPDDFSCFGGINVIKEHGLSIPDDISVAGYDGIRIGRHIEPQLTTLRQDVVTIGSKAAEKLVDLIERPKSAIIEQIMVPGTVYPGKTVGKIN